MAEWSNILRQDLDEAKAGMPQALGLTEGLSGTDFEEIVGAVLRFRSSFHLNRRFMRLGSPTFRGVPTQVGDWMKAAEENGSHFERVLWKSLWREFGLAAIDPELARKAYAGLIDLLGIRSTPFVIATTNYDLAAEVALDLIGLEYTNGFDTATIGTRFLRPRNIVDWPNGHRDKVPVLHLHGAVGWYRKPGDDRVYYQPPDQEFNATLGTPAVIAPDPEKDPENDPSVGGIWREFRSALEGATHIVVIGHSLTDEPLVRALSASKHNRILVIRPDISDLGSRIPSAQGVEARFSAEPEDLEKLKGPLASFLSVRNRSS